MARKISLVSRFLVHRDRCSRPLTAAEKGALIGGAVGVVAGAVIADAARHPAAAATEVVGRRATSGGRRRASRVVVPTAPHGVGPRWALRDGRPRHRHHQTSYYQYSTATGGSLRLPGPWPSQRHHHRRSRVHPAGSTTPGAESLHGGASAAADRADHRASATTVIVAAPPRLHRRPRPLGKSSHRGRTCTRRLSHRGRRRSSATGRRRPGSADGAASGSRRRHAAPPVAAALSSSHLRRRRRPRLPRLASSRAGAAAGGRRASSPTDERAPAPPAQVTLATPPAAGSRTAPHIWVAEWACTCWKSGRRLLQRGLLLVLGRAMVDLAIARGPWRCPDAAAVIAKLPPAAPQPPAARAPLPAWSRQAGALLASDRQRPSGVGNNDSSPSNQKIKPRQVHEGIREFLLEYLALSLGRSKQLARRANADATSSISSNLHH